MTSVAVQDGRLKLDLFEGPLDLLLYLIRKHELDIHDIPIVDVTAQYQAMLDEARREGLLDLDFAGDYFLIRSPLEATRPRFLCVGNDHIPATENVRCLTYIESAPDRRGREFRLMAYVLGSSPTSAPVLSGSMLGVTMTRYDGRHQSFGLVFLPLGTVDEGAPTDDRLLVMPRRGELVIDVKFDFAQKFPERYPDEWRTTYAPRAARILAGIGPD